MADKPPSLFFSVAFALNPECPPSSLALLVALVLADDTENACALHDAAVVAHSFH